MKTATFKPVMLALFLAMMIPSFGQEQADKKKQEADMKKKQEQMRVIIESKKDANKDLQKALEESLKAEEQALKEKQKKGYIDARTFIRESEALKDYTKQLQEMQSTGENWNLHSDMKVSAPYTWSFREPSVPNVYGIYAGNRENTSMSISKSLEDVTFSTDFTYEVKEESSNVSFSVSGMIKGGELKITVKRPDKTTLQEFTISPLADVNWSQQLKWDEDEADNNTGKWIISISALKATGNYRVQVNSR